MDRKEYHREYYKKNRAEILKRQREWRKANPDKIGKYQARYWEKKTAEMQDELNKLERD